jgi:hypothetical protein
MARSTDTKRTAAKRKMPAKRSPTRRSAGAAAPRTHRPEEQATPVAANGAAATESAGAFTREAAGKRAPEPEAAAAALRTATTDEHVEPAASPAERPAGHPEPAPPARTADVPSAAVAQVASAPADIAAAVAEASAAAAPAPPRGLIEGTIGMHGQMIAFACRQTEFGLATSRAMLASRSLPEIVSLQSAFIGRSVENALAHTLELTRLSAEMLRDGLHPGSAR